MGEVGLGLRMSQNNTYVTYFLGLISHDRIHTSSQGSEMKNRERLDKCRRRDGKSSVRPSKWEDWVRLPVREIGDGPEISREMVEGTAPLTLRRRFTRVKTNMQLIYEDYSKQNIFQEVCLLFVPHSVVVILWLSAYGIARGVSIPEVPWDFGEKSEIDGITEGLMGHAAPHQNEAARKWNRNRKHSTGVSAVMIVINVPRNENMQEFEVR